MPPKRKTRTKSESGSSGTEQQKYDRKTQRWLRRVRCVGDCDVASWKIKLGLLGLQLREVEGDGNCLFRALGDQLDGRDLGHLKHRAAVVGFMQRNQADFEPFITGATFNEHVQSLARPGTYAGNDALVAFSRLHQLNTVVHQLNSPAFQINGTSQLNARELHLSYHNEEHYSSVRRSGDNSDLPANIRLIQLQASEKQHRPSRLVTFIAHRSVDEESESEEKTVIGNTSLGKAATIDGLTGKFEGGGHENNNTVSDIQSLQAGLPEHVEPTSSKQCESVQVPMRCQDIEVSKAVNKSGAHKKANKKKEKKKRAEERRKAELTGSAKSNTRASADAADFIVTEKLEMLCI